MAEPRPVKLGEVADFLTGFPFKSADYTDESVGIRLIRGDNIIQGAMRWEGVKRWPTHLANQSEDYRLFPGDVVLAMDRPWIEAGLKYAALSDDDCPSLLVQRVTRLRGTERIDKGFLRYVIGGRHFTDYVLAVQTGTAVPHISGGQIKAFQFLLPDIAEQRSIASVLGALDDKIELNRQMNETLEAMARAIFKDWFVDFGPTRAKAEGRAPYLASGLWSLFPDRLDDEGKPEGWREGTLADVSNLNSESWTAENRPSQLEYVDLSNTKWGVIEAAETYVWDAAPSRARRVLRSGDTIVGTVRPGNGSYALVGLDGLTGSTGFAVLRPRKRIFREFIYCAATSSDNVDRLAHLADGGAYPAVRPDVVAGTPLFLASSAISEAFSAVCCPMIDQMEANKRQNRTLAKTRDLLLPKLMSGEIRVREAEVLLAAAQ